MQEIDCVVKKPFVSGMLYTGVIILVHFESEDCWRYDMKCRLSRRVEDDDEMKICKIERIL